MSLWIQIQRRQAHDIIMQVGAGLASCHSQALGLPPGAVTHQPPSKQADCLPAPPSYQSCPELTPSLAGVVRSRPH